MATLLWLPVIGWLVSPIINFLVNKLLSILDFNLSRKLRELQLHIIPSLKLILADVTEQRILRRAKDEDKGCASDLKTLGELEKDLKSAMYDAEDALDLIEYLRIEKKVIGGDGKSIGTMIRNWMLQAIGECIACWKGTSFVEKLWQCPDNQNQQLMYLGDKLQQCIQKLNMKFWDLLAKLQQYAQNLNQMFGYLPLRATKLVQCVQSLNMYIRQGTAGPPPMPDAPAEEFRDDIEQGIATPSPTPDAPSTSNPPSPNALPISAGPATELRGENHYDHVSVEQVPMLDAPSNSLVQIAWDLFSYVFSQLRSFYLAVRLLRDWSYEPVGIKIFSLRKRIKNIEYIVSESEKSSLLNQSSCSSNSTIKNSAEASSSTQKEIDDLYRNIEQKVFGREENREHISMMLRRGPDTYAACSSTSKPYSVIGIYGITGSGKSTLAQYVCDSEKDARHFNPIMFIQVGKTFSLGDIWRDMLEQIKQSGSSNDIDLKSLKTELWENLRDKRFLLVLDDVWVNDENQKELAILLGTLNAALNGSRILVTAQKKDAAEALGAQEQISIPDLEEEVYLSLFMHHARPDAANDYGEYERIGRKIANRLCRSPIAAVTVGKQLQRNKSISFWETTANLDVLDKTMGALWWSYQQLGVDIRKCFAYCSTFPKGYGLKRDDLVGIWIAQGFINPRINATEELEALGQSYFDQLLTFSFLEVQRTFFFLDEKIVEFTIHDLLHELAERVFGFGLFDSLEDIPRGVRHVFIGRINVTEINDKILDLGNLRTLIINEDPFAGTTLGKNIKRNHDLEKLLGRLFVRLKKLRVLIIKLNCGIDELSVPACIDQMKHLRYLGFHFRGGLFNLILPSTFSKLYHIQIVDIPCFKEVSCPEGMANLICLRHISGRLSFPNIGRLTSLQTIKEFRVENGQGHELKQLMHLNKLRGTLCIKGLGIVGSKEEALEAHLTHKERLSKLKLIFGLFKRFGPDVEAEVLEGLCPPKDIQELEILEYKGSTYPSWMLSRHHPEGPKQLHKLELSGCSQLAFIPEDSQLFIGLRELEIFGCDWHSLPQNMERLVSLRKLLIWWCDKMELLPTLPQSLERISIHQCDLLSKTFEEEEHENWYKIQHIPKKDID